MSTFSRPSGSHPGAITSTAVLLRSTKRAATLQLSRRRRRLRRALLAGGGLVAALLLLAQAVLPALAEREVRSALGPQASGVHVEIKATPAIKLLWRRADSVTVRVDRLTPTGTGHGSVGQMLTGLRVAPKMDLRIGDLRARGMHLHGVVVHKDGNAVSGRADVDLRSLQSSLPAGLRIRPLSSSSDGVHLEGTIAPLGRPVQARATLLADDGAIVVRPDGIPFGSLLTVPVFSDRHIAVDGLAAQPTGDGMALEARAHLRQA